MSGEPLQPTSRRNFENFISHQEIDFIAEEEAVEIIPNFSSTHLIHLSTGSAGPFQAQIPVKVPLWLAIVLKLHGKCVIKPPLWLSVAKLEAVLNLERSDEVFQSVPFHFIEVTHALCKHARDDLDDWNQLYDLTEHIRSVRQSKIQTGLRTLDASALRGVKLNNLAAIELNIIRPFMTDALGMFLQHQTAKHSR